MTTTEINEKIRGCKALQGMTILDVCNTDRFKNNLSRYWEAQKQDKKAANASLAAMRKEGKISPRAKLPSHPIDRLWDLSVDNMITEYLAVVAKVSPRSANERKYIYQLGQQAYNLTVVQYVCEEFPELEAELLPKKQAN